MGGLIIILGIVLPTLLFADLTNRANASADSPAGPVTASATALVTVLQPSIGITKTPEAQSVNPGEAASFTITLSNPGVTTLTELAVSDPLTPDCGRALGNLFQHRQVADAQPDRGRPRSRPAGSRRCRRSGAQSPDLRRP